MTHNSITKENIACVHRVIISNVVGWLVVLGLTVLLDNILVYTGPSPKEREKEESKDR